ncbi:MAG: hypothetical protein JRG73_12165 [Deltaproteobacteria bacterium]|nr:hypothetical protein [Deltaproteobacteria bacterium]
MLQYHISAGMRSWRRLFSGSPTLAVLSLAVAVLYSCAGEGDSESRGGVSFDAINVLIFQPRCAVRACHDSSTQAAGLNLSSGSAFGDLVNVPSAEVPGLLRVAPGDPEASYLVNKIRGTAGMVGGVDTRMPLGQAPLSDEEINTIVQWIETGAEP